jgi:signal transduction histidine kinase/CheY-like chemotaxis protein
MPISWGVDIPGRVIATGRLQWNVSLSTLDTVSRVEEGERLGLKRGFGFPVVLGRDVSAVLEFFSDRDELSKDSELFDVIEVIATQLARVIERRKAEQDLIRARESALEASSAKSDFLAQMSHEIRTPINAVMGVSQLLLSTTLNPEQREYAEVIRKSTQSLLSIVNDVLDLSKIEAGKLDIQIQDFQLDTLFKDLFSMFSYSAKSKNLALQLDLDPGIAPALRGDAGRLKQILVNLVGNAIKFTDTGRIEVSASRQRETEDVATLRFEVKDTGIGIAKKLHSKIFEMFSQVDVSSERKHGGTGLGLSISRRLVELMGGAIDFQSNEGLGSVFWFTVELQKPLTTVKSLSVAALNLPMERAIDRTGISVLVVEDNLVNQMVMVRILQRKGFFAKALSSGEEALRSLAVDSYDVVLMDCQMPEMDGFETSRRIREWEKQTQRCAIPIIAVTANAVTGDREKCFSAGMDDYLTKPVDTELLLSRIAQKVRPTFW